MLLSLGNITLCRPSFEPHCSRFDYDEKLLEKMVRMEHANEVMFTNVEDFKNQAKQNLDSGLEGLEERVMQKIGQMEHTNEVMFNNAKEFTDKTTKYLETLKKDLDEKLANITSLQGEDILLVECHTDFVSLYFLLFLILLLLFLTRCLFFDVVEILS